MIIWVVVLEDIRFLDNISSNYLSQKNKNIELHIITKNAKKDNIKRYFVRKKITNIKIIRLVSSGNIFEDGINESIFISQDYGKFWGLMNEKYYYGPNYLNEQIGSCTNNIVCKRKCVIYDLNTQKFFKGNIEKESVDTLIIDYSLLDNFRSLREVVRKNKVLSTSSDNFVLIKNNKNGNSLGSICQVPDYVSKQIKLFATENNVGPADFFKKYDILPEYSSQINMSKPLYKDKIAIIADEFTESMLSDFFVLIPLKLNSRDIFIKHRDIKFLFVESTWFGNRGIWKNRIIRTSNKKIDSNLEEIIGYCKSIDIKTVFWNKEDPVYYESFINTAKHFDYIYTTDEKCIRRYRQDTNAQFIKSLSFFTNPFKNNPIGKTEDYDILFAGSWYFNMKGDRKRTTELLLDSSIKSGKELHIFDRFSSPLSISANNTSVTFNMFPSKYNNYIYCGIEYDKLVNLAKKFKIVLNVNSVTDSFNMFSRRVYETIGTKTELITGNSKGIYEKFGDYVHIVENEKEFQEAIESIDHWENSVDNEIRLHNGWRNIVHNYTVDSFFATIYKNIGIKYPRVPIKIYIVYTDKNKKNTISQQIKTQKYEYISLLFVKADNIKDLLKIKKGYLLFIDIDKYEKNNKKDILHLISDTFYLLRYSHSGFLEMKDTCNFSLERGIYEYNRTKICPIGTFTLVKSEYLKYVDNIDYKDHLSFCDEKNIISCS